MLLGSEESGTLDARSGIICGSLEVDDITGEDEGVKARYFGHVVRWKEQDWFGPV